jgi:uncharacterized glyoxalase superfamily protein PhnB
MKFNKLTPNFEVADVRQTVQFYQTVLGFSLTAAVPESQDGVHQQLADDAVYVFAMMKHGDVELMFQRSDSFKHDVEIAENESIGASVSFYIEIEGIQQLFDSIKDKVAKITPIKKTWYGADEFYMHDLNGYILGFGELSTKDSE